MYVPRPSQKDIRDRLERIERNQRAASNRNSIAFGITIMLIGWNFFAGADENIGIKIAAILLIVCGFAIMALPTGRGLRSLKERLSKRK
jgi:hypothetical protein